MILQIGLFGTINDPYPPTYQGGPGLKLFLDNLISAVFTVSGLLLLLYLIFGAFKYLTAGGDDKAIGDAKKTLTNAIVGMGILAASFFIINILEIVLGIDILTLTFEGP